MLVGTLFANGDSWSQILKEKKGTVKFYWYPSNTVIENSLDIIDGIERDLAIAFVDYLERKYEVSIELQWLETNGFQDVLQIVKESRGGIFGASSISITPERGRYLNFTAPYMADIAVLVSNNYLPVALTEDELKRILTGNTAISIDNTTLNQSLELIQEKLNIDFDIEYVSNSGQIIDRISQKTRSFGYVDIANFLDAIDHNIDVKRQFFYPVKLEGLAMVYPKNSDWGIPVEEYFNSQQFEFDKFRIITKYLGSDAYEIIGRISKSAEIGPLEEIVISNREKEAQYERLLEAARRDQDSERLTIILISIIVVVLVILSLLYALYFFKSKNNDRLLEQQKLVEDANIRLRTLNEDKNNLIKVLAHDLRSPLSNILNGAQIIESGEKLSDQGKTILGFILQSSEKMSSLIDKILDADSIEAGQHNINLERFKINDVIRQVVKDNKEKAKQKSITVKFNSKRSKAVLADNIYTAQVIDNLVSNAIKYSEVGTEVEIHVKEVDGMVRISVQDEGPGLTKEDEKKLFKKYQQLSARPTKGEASIGLGLSIVKNFTERMGGKVSYDTELGKGTTFHIHLRKA
ncbi:ATP-binding protein [Ekhidna sp.]|uniref:ATP-binding protein n=1 Tax=Ekhidna sp. TaxID=2608089 RepID=UPI00329937BB